MCGIFAAWTNGPLPQSKVEAALASLYHRGPDGNGTWTSQDKLQTLGHTRLSIIGLNNGDQPMSSADSALHMVVNGEFYGYRAIRDDLRSKGYKFQTDSDSEIALHLFRRMGMSMMPYLRGEFAIVLADQRSGEMIGIRDRFGIKPLYYANINGEVFFASEIKALLALGVPASWDWTAAAAGLAHPNDETYFAGIKSVPPGCYVIARNGETQVQTYWDWELPTSEDLREDTRSEEEVTAQFREVLLNAVSERQVADVEVACYLSGGIDSCAVLGLAQKHMDRPIRAFTLTFEDALYNEADIAKAQAKMIGAEYNPIPITGRDLADSFSDAVWHSETAFFNGHAISKFLLSKNVRDAGVKVVFTGEGADEMLGGYPFFRVDAIRGNASLSEDQKAAIFDEIFAANPSSRAIMLPDASASPVAKMLEDRFGWISATMISSAGLAAGTEFYRDSLLESIGDKILFERALDRLPLGQRLHGRDTLNQSLYFGAKVTLPNMILNYLGDRMEMAHSIEGRVPFLDHHVAENAAHIPLDMKIKGIREKHVLREATKDVLIPEVYDRQKHPFMSAPAKDTNDPLIGFLRDSFASEAAKDQPIFDHRRIGDLIETLDDLPVDRKVGVEAALIRAACMIHMQDRFGMTQGG
ncbi:asparagine synthase (glutamine-hydrolyzing) [Altererythrobacter sp. MF3-039]|uniref:asparagine synthase (glutamine-hydrolyzing) n=1 Tax=Altererythrobacter sp. MF3-039 TaxID=3252901 RepID=UPI00390C6045